MKQLWNPWALLFLYIMSKGVIDPELRQENIEIASAISWDVVLHSAGVLLLAWMSYTLLTRFLPGLGQNVYRLFSLKKVAQAGNDVLRAPSDIRIVGALFALLVTLNTPRVAMIIEEWFRSSVDTWEGGIVMSFLYGLTFCLFGASLGFGLVASGVGLWLTHLYFIGGLEYSAAHQATLLLIPMVPALCVVIFVHSRKKWFDTATE